MTETLHTLQTAQQLCELLQQRHEYARVLITLQQQQQQFVSQQQHQELMQLLATRQQAFTALEIRQQQIQQLNLAWPEVMEETLSQLQHVCRDWDRKTVELLSKVREQDDAMTTQMQAQQQEVKRQLLAISQAENLEQEIDPPKTQSQFDFGCV